MSSRSVLCGFFMHHRTHLPSVPVSCLDRIRNHRLAFRQRTLTRHYHSRYTVRLAGRRGITSSDSCLTPILIVRLAAYEIWSSYNFAALFISNKGFKSFILRNIQMIIFSRRKLICHPCNMVTNRSDKIRIFSQHVLL